ncbi:restriction endonuclease subunit S, partial [Pseudomonadota bacterium]
LYPDKLIRARVNDKVLPKYVEIYFSSPRIRDQVTGCVKTTSGQKGISGKDIKSQTVSVPSVEEQKEIVRRVESLFILADTVEKQYQAAKKRLDSLSQSILAKAFRGELVPQNPNDEPAEKLLERIRAEREQQAQRAPKKKRVTKKRQIKAGAA